METIPHKIDILVGQAIRARRRAIGQSQEALAQGCGVSFQQIQKYEKASNRVSMSMLWLIAQTQGQPMASYFDAVERAAEPLTGVTDPVMAFLNSTEAVDFARQLTAMRPETRRVARRILDALGEGQWDTPESVATKAAAARQVLEVARG